MSRVRILQVYQADQLRDGEVAVVVDVLRATSTIAVALDRGARCVVPVENAETARRASESLEAPLLVGERDRGALDGFVDNSPAALAAMDLADRAVVLTTTNGTGALLASRGAARVLAGGLVNATALCEALAGEDVALVAAGWRGEAASDDTACCEYLAALMRGEAPDLGVCLERLEKSTSARKLRQAGKGDDVDLCLTPDAAPVVAELRGARMEARARGV